jgi:metallo-beta-lactamase class B
MRTSITCKLTRSSVGKPGLASLHRVSDAGFIESGGKGEPVFDGVYSWTPCPVDWRVNDGDVVTLGQTTFAAHLTPGHTPGATTWTMQVEDGGQRLDVVFFPSANVNRGVKLLNNPRYPRIVSDFESSFRKWKALKCQVFLANHGDFYAMRDKYDQLQSGGGKNPFIDPEGYQRFVAEAEQRFRDELDAER